MYNECLLACMRCSGRVFWKHLIQRLLSGVAATWRVRAGTVRGTAVTFALIITILIINRAGAV